MDIRAIGKYSKHIALFGKLLRISDLRVSYEGNSLDDQLRLYYSRAAMCVNEECDMRVPCNCFENILVENCTFVEHYDTLMCDDIHEAEDRFLILIAKMFDLTEPFMLEKTLVHFLKRDVTEEELAMHDSNNHKKNINVFKWVCILNARIEEFKTIYNFEIKQKRLAVILSGYLRHSQHHSHLPLIQDKNVDIFIHTWNEYGFKNEMRLIDNVWLSGCDCMIDVDSLQDLYKPVKISVEDNRKILDEFSLLRSISPVFLYAGQAKDDATKYVNSQLYSLNAAYQMVCDHETENGFKYDGILRLMFDYQIEFIDLTGVLKDLDSADVHFPHAGCNCHKHAGGGGGCMLCDKNKEHDKHGNDLCDLWFYGRRDLVGPACEMYFKAFQVLSDNHAANMEFLSGSNYSVSKDGFVYISSTKDIEEKFVCFYPERILREVLTGTCCKSSKFIRGKLIQKSM